MTILTDRMNVYSYAEDWKNHILKLEFFFHRILHKRKVLKYRKDYTIQIKTKKC